MANTNNNSSHNNLKQLLKAIDQQEKMPSSEPVSIVHKSSESESRKAAGTSRVSANTNRSSSSNNTSRHASASMPMIPSQLQTQEQQERQQVVPQQHQQQRQQAPAFLGQAPPNVVVNNDSAAQLHQLILSALQFPNPSRNQNTAIMQSLLGFAAGGNSQHQQFPMPKPGPTATTNNGLYNATAAPIFMNGGGDMDKITAAQATRNSNQDSAPSTMQPQTLLDHPLNLLQGMGLPHVMQQLGVVNVGTKTNRLPYLNAPTMQSNMALPAFNFSNPNRHWQEPAKGQGDTGGNTAATTKSNDEEVTPKSFLKTIILPCRARGMPLDHNFQSAHFVIPHDVRHGEDLVCSYKQCRDSGNKFRFCSVCRIPVAKRNFHQRHGHSMDCVTATEPTPLRTVSAAATLALQKVTRNNSSATATDAPNMSKKQDKKRKNSIQKQEEQLESTTNFFHESSQSTHERRKKEITRHAASNSDDGVLHQEVSSVSIARQLRWVTLLGKRPSPDDTDGMSAWLLEVMTVSDLKSPLRRTFASSSIANNASREDTVFGRSNSNHPAMGSSGNSSLSTDVLTSDASSEVNALIAPESDRKMPAKPTVVAKDRPNQEQKESKKDAGNAIRWQEETRKAQKRKKRRSFEMDHCHRRNKKSQKNTFKSLGRKSNRDKFKEAGISEVQVKMVQEDNANMPDNESSNDSPDNEELSASYAEWQERKKQKSLRLILEPA